MKKQLFLMCCVMVLALNACGKTSDNNTDSSDNAKQVESTEDEAASGGKTDLAEGSDNSSEGQETASQQNQVEAGKWTVQQERDEFGDVVEGSDNYLVTTVEGTFSNSATASSDLHVEVFLKDAGAADNDIWFYFYLYEYGDNPVTPLTGAIYNMKIKNEDNAVYDFALETVPNSDAIVFIDHGRAYGKHMYERLCLGQSIKCIISSGTSKYNFTLESSNFTDACEEIGYSVYQDPATINDVDTALQLLNEGKQFDYGDRITELLLPLFETIEPMNTEEIAEAIKPGNWSENNPKFSMHNAKYVFSEDGTYEAYKGQFDIKYAWKIEDDHLQTALIRHGETGDWIAKEVRKIKDGYYLIGSGKEESVGYDIKVLVESDENFDPVFPIE